MRLTHPFFLFFLLCNSVHAEQQVQHWLAAQHDWGASRGFFLSVQNVATPGAPATLANCRVQLGVGDGQQWTFVEAKSTWATNKKYNVRAVVKDGIATLWIDGEKLDSKPVNMLAADGSLSAGYQPSFLVGPADYRVVQSFVHVVSDLDQLQQVFEAPPDDAAMASLRILNPTIGALVRPFKTRKSVVVEARFEFKAGTIKSEPPQALVDRYGQAVAAKFPGKITSDQQLIDQIAIEESQLKEWQRPQGYDEYGGSIAATFKSEATGYFHVERKNDFWWLISPKGNPCFYLGVCDAPSLTWEGTPVTGREKMFAELPPRNGEFAQAWRKNIWSSESPDSEYLIPHAVNLIRKYGRGWQQKATDSTVARLHAMGFNGLGKWSQAVPRVPIVPVLYLVGVDNLTAHPDPWNPKTQKQIRDWLEKEIGERRNDPWIVGWSIGNEKDAFPSIDDVRKILSSPETTPARIALLEHAKANGIDPTKDEALESLRSMYANKLFQLYYHTIKQVDPDHLYFGNWVTPNWWVNENDWDSSARNCDVIGFDRYAMRLADEPMKRLLDSADKPAICGEFSFPPDYANERGQGTYPVAVRTEQEAGQKYKQWIADCAAQPKVIGALYFQYRDQPLLGRGPGAGANSPVLGENFAFGLIDITDRLKLPLCQAVRDANLQAATIRLKACAAPR